MSVYPVIMCGGSGSRLWPASTPALPKQFAPLLGPLSTFQQTVQRVAGLKDAGGELLIVAGAGHAQMLARQLEAIGERAVLLLEPEARDSAPAMAAAAAFIADRDPDGIAVILAADHHVPDVEDFQAVARRAVEIARAGHIVTLGVTPSAPSSAYGYIRPGAALPGFAEASAVAAFVEKPDAQQAQAYIEAGYFWNSGNFVVRAATLLDELDLYAPETAVAAREAVRGAAPAGPGLLLGEGFAKAPKLSIDYAVMERTSRAVVTPAAFAWSDLGAWDAIREAAGLDDSGNAVFGQVEAIEVRDSLLRAAPGSKVAVIGLAGVAVVVEPDGVLVCSLADSQKVKAAADRLKPAARPLDVEGELAEQARRFDLWLRTSALPLWWTLGADHEHGGFHELLGQDGRPVRAPRRMRVQARQVHVYASAGLAGWRGPWRQAVDHGLSYLAQRYRRADGLYRTLVDADGQPLNDEAVLYDQAFVLLALASAYSVDPREAYRTEARALRERVMTAFRHPGGGFREAGDRPFQSNPHMHLLEAALAWKEADGGPEWMALAEEIAKLALARFIDREGGFLREFFDETWAPAPGADGRIVEPGHQFEWAWLLRRVGERQAAQRLFAIGERGVNLAGLAIDEMGEDLSPARSSARLWPQTERVKAALILAGDASDKGYEIAALSAARGLGRYLDASLPGLWLDKAMANGSLVDEPAPASSFYHLAGAIAALKAV